jgi:deoxyribodipyrimidine photolyase-related protein
MNQPVSVWILGNQLLSEHPALRTAEKRASREDIRVLVVESQHLLKHRPSHPAKLVLLLSAMRHYTTALEKAGYKVDYRQEPSFLEGIQGHLQAHNPSRLLSMAASDYAGRRFQETTLPEEMSLPLEVLPNTQFLIDQYNPYPQPDPDKRYIMEYFYRDLRVHFQVLVDERGGPTGGEWNYDRQNRKSLPTDIHIPPPLTFFPDEITREVIAQHLTFNDPSADELDFTLAVTHHQAEQALEDFIQHRLADFGPYEDAMTSRSPVIFHSRLSTYLNIGLLTPLQVIQSVETAYERGEIPIQSAEGFIRQVLGWREYMYWQYWRGMPKLEEGNHWDARRPLPDFFWNGETKLNCLREVLGRALSNGYNHHIERLMVLSNFCTLTSIRPQEVLDWFMATYIDAYPWVMVPNVIGMVLHADGGVIGTKPYISSANYIQKMSDYCQNCDYDHNLRTGKRACPFNILYWNFLLHHQDRLSTNPRMNLSLSNLRHLDSQERKAVQKQADRFIKQITGTTNGNHQMESNI